MLEAYYTFAFTLSLALMLVYAFFYHRHYDIHISLIFILVPISNLAQLVQSQCKSMEAALLANKFLYIGGCYLILMITLAVFSLCDIKLNRYVRLLLYLVTTVVFLFTQQIGKNDLYYRDVSFAYKDGGIILLKEYGVLHTLYYAMMIIYFLLGAGAIIYSFFRKNQVSNRFIALLALPEATSFITFFVGRGLSKSTGIFHNLELIPITYDLALIMFLIISHKLVLYNVPDTVIETVVQKGNTGFISFDFKYRYLGSNQIAREIFPELNSLNVDEPITESSLSETVLKWLEEFSSFNGHDIVLHHCGDKVYRISIDYLSDGTHKRGYQLYITDDTKDQQYISLLDSFNSELKEEVAQKTAHIVEMHDNLILSMATMVESRDNSTGGHIRRTSEGVRILLDEMMQSGDFDLSEDFCRNIIKAAPMHDLGKIAVDDAILRKPGRFTDEEFAIMKTHAAEGARIVHEILKGTDDEQFKILAENVAHYHHERWDGSGYPEGLSGEDIPLEARIMAIADVYDALVSKRVYKDRMSFEQADRIIMEGMGKHFDKRLEPCYVAARPRLEEYYSSLQ